MFTLSPLSGAKRKLAFGAARAAFDSKPKLVTVTRDLANYSVDRDGGRVRKFQDTLETP